MDCEQDKPLPKLLLSGALMWHTQGPVCPAQLESSLFTTENNTITRAAFQCQFEPYFCLGFYRRSRNLTECVCTQITHVWVSERTPPFSSALMLYSGQCPGHLCPYLSACSHSLSMHRKAQKLCARGYCFGTYRWLSNSGVPCACCFSPKN